jgi:MYXO-CTERM domain-containing protein
MRSSWFLAAAVGCLLAAPALANEGQWTPDQIEELDRAQLEAMGLQLTSQELWDPSGDERTGGLMRAAVNFSGCSAAFVSPDGLIATNHHCAYGALQANSTPEHDYIKNGFLAATKADELESKGRTIKVLRKVTDVTEKIRSKADAENSDRARAKLISRVRKELVKECETADPGLQCQVSAFYNGSEYRLFEYLELRDVRVVYAPPAAVGEYGGEVDNWMWPRHTGDFSLVRAYVDPAGKPAEFSTENVPYQPGQYLKLSTEGVRHDSFVAVLGYPGQTRRYLSAPDVQHWIEQVLPGRVDQNGEWIEILERLGASDDAVKIKVAAMKKGLANRHKNARGMLAGLEHMQLLENRRAEERKLREWVKGQPQYEGVLDELSKLSAHQESTHERNTVLSGARRGPQSLGIAIDLARRARAQSLPDLERPSGYMERDQKRLWKRQERRLRDFDLGVDAELLASLLARNGTLDPEQRIEPLSKLSKKAPEAKDRGGYLELTKSLVEGSVLSDATKVEELWNGADLAALEASKDPMLSLGIALAELIEQKEEQDLEHSGAMARLRPKYFEMLKAVRKGPIYPDANGTLRFSYASVTGYDKWDGQRQVPQTVLAGAVAKHTGEDPFDLPQKVRDAAASAKNTHWADPNLGDLPLCFLSNADTTGGNSGSPVIDGQGRLVGFNFDRVWENIAGDFNYFDGHSRNVSADVRYLLWMLDEVDDASHLLAELGVAKYRGIQRDADRSAMAGSDSVQSERDSNSAAKGCGCSTAPTGSGWWLLTLLAPALRRRAPRRLSPRHQRS